MLIRAAAHGRFPNTVGINVGNIGNIGNVVGGNGGNIGNIVGTTFLGSGLSTQPKFVNDISTGTLRRN